MIRIDTETCGFHGPIVLLQWSKEPEKIHLHEVWRRPLNETLELIEDICNEGVVGFNLTFDWFHLCKTYTTLELLKKHFGNVEPIHYIDEYAVLEKKARLGRCLKPAKALDLMLYARKGPYQSTMDRKDIRIRRVPRQLSASLVAELEKRIPLKQIYFSKLKDKLGNKWKIAQTDDPQFVDIYLKFRPSSALKALIADIKDTDIIDFKDIAIDKRYMPIEFQWAPYATAVAKPPRWYIKTRKYEGYAWPRFIVDHILHWQHNRDARQYATDDITYLWDLEQRFKPEPNDTDSILSCMVGAVRWRGFAVDLKKMKEQRDAAYEKSRQAPIAPNEVRRYITQVMTDEEKEYIDGSTSKMILEALAQWTIDAPAEVSNDYDTFLSQLSTGGTKPHPVAIRAKNVLEARQHKYRVDVFDKILMAERFHAAATVTGSLSSRMSGRTESKGAGRSESGLNALGIGHTKEVRECFTFGDHGLVLCGGDFVSFEVCIAVAKYNDKNLLKDVLTCYKCKHVWETIDHETCPKCGGHDTLQKFHGLFAQAIYPDKSYEDILATQKSEDDLYDKGKRGGFAKIYGGNANTLENRLGIPLEIAEQAERNFEDRYVGVFEARKEIENKFCSMRQPNGIGTQVEWHNPAPYIESMTGFRRYFDVENKICRTLFDLANAPPESWRQLDGIIRRRDRDQKIGGATQSAVYAAAFQIQAQNMRAAANHEIQSTGAELTKELQARLWALQPSGVNDWSIMLMNIHDEIMAPMKPELFDDAQRIVDDFIQEKRSIVPLLRIGWSTNLNSWADK